MRTYGRIKNQDGTLKWVTIQTEPNGNNDYVWITTLAQTLLLVLGESPFYANYGIPAIQSVIQQIFPNFYVNQIQNQFGQYFASLIISQVNNGENPEYTINILTNQGTKFNATIAT